MSATPVVVTTPQLAGRSLIAGETAPVSASPSTFHADNPATGEPLEPAFHAASPDDVDRAVNAAADAFPAFAAISGAERARFLRDLADALDAAAPSLIDRAHLETALPRPRLTGEVGRTSGQLRLFASMLEEGSWVGARIDTADAARTPPKPDIRSMLRPLGPVAVFGASNFPLAFSVAGGDTASALAAGCPVVVKAHPAHPGTSELVGHLIAAAVLKAGLPAGTFSLLFDHGHTVGAALVQHPGIRAVGFTGSFRGGRALMDLAQKRPDPIPVYAEMGSTNPVFLLPGALAARSEQLATGLHTSFTLGAGQFCTKPGLVFAEAAHSADFTGHLRSATTAGPAHTLLTAGIRNAFTDAQSSREHLRTAHGTEPANGFSAQSILLETTASNFEADPTLAHEVFGPTTLLVHCDTHADLLRAAHTLDGHLTATVLATDDDLAGHADLLAILETRVGRLIVNSFPTGVEVNGSMVHGGPYPATSDGRSTSVGSQAIFRFTRPVAFQGLPQAALYPALQDTNPLRIHRLVNGQWTAPTL